MRMQSDTRVEVKRFFRPEDISRERAYAASFHEVYASEDLLTLDLDDVVGPCTVVPAGGARGLIPFHPWI